MSKDMKVFLGLVAVVMIALFTSSVFDASSAERRAIRWEAEAGMRLQARRGVEANLALMADAYEELVGETLTLRDSVKATSDLMAEAQLEAGRRADSLVARVEEVAGDSVATVAWADSLVVAHREEVRAVETRLAVTMTMNEALWRRIEQSDAIIEQHIEANALLRMEIEAWQNASGSWQDAYRAGWLSRIADNPKLVVVSVAAGIGLCVAFCPEDPQVAGAYLIR